MAIKNIQSAGVELATCKQVSVSLDDVSRFTTTHTVYYEYFRSELSEGTKPFSDGYLITFYWSSGYIHQVAIEDENNKIYHRYYRASWSSWSAIAS